MVTLLRDDFTGSGPLVNRTPDGVGSGVWTVSVPTSYPDAPQVDGGVLKTGGGYPATTAIDWRGSIPVVSETERIYVEMRVRTFSSNGMPGGNTVHLEVSSQSLVLQGTSSVSHSFDCNTSALMTPAIPSWMRVVSEKNTLDPSNRADFVVRYEFDGEEVRIFLDGLLWVRATKYMTGPCTGISVGQRSPPGYIGIEYVEVGDLPTSPLLPTRFGTPFFGSNAGAAGPGIWFKDDFTGDGKLHGRLPDGPNFGAWEVTAYPTAPATSGGELYDSSKYTTSWKARVLVAQVGSGANCFLQAKLSMPTGYIAAHLGLGLAANGAGPEIGYTVSLTGKTNATVRLEAWGGWVDVVVDDELVTSIKGVPTQPYVTVAARTSSPTFTRIEEVVVGELGIYARQPLKPVTFGAASVVRSLPTLMPVEVVLRDDFTGAGVLGARIPDGVNQGAWGDDWYWGSGNTATSTVIEDGKLGVSPSGYWFGARVPAAIPSGDWSYLQTQVVSAIPGAYVSTTVALRRGVSDKRGGVFAEVYSSGGDGEILICKLQIYSANSRVATVQGETPRVDATNFVLRVLTSGNYAYLMIDDALVLESYIPDSSGLGDAVYLQSDTNNAFFGYVEAGSAEVSKQRLEPESLTPVIFGLPYNFLYPDSLSPIRFGHPFRELLAAPVLTAVFGEAVLVYGQPPAASTLPVRNGLEAVRFGAHAVWIGSPTLSPQPLLATRFAQHSTSLALTASSISPVVFGSATNTTKLGVLPLQPLRIGTPGTVMRFTAAPLTPLRIGGATILLKGVSLVAHSLTPVIFGVPGHYIVAYRVAALCPVYFGRPSALGDSTC